MKLTWFVAFFSGIVGVAFVWWVMLIQIDDPGLGTGLVMVVSFVWVIWSTLYRLVRFG